MPRNRRSVYKNIRYYKNIKNNKTRKYKLKGGENEAGPDKELYDSYVRKLLPTLGALGKKNFLAKPEYERPLQIVSLMRPSDPSFLTKNWAEKAESIKTVLSDYRKALYEMYKAKSPEEGEEFMNIKNWTDIQAKVDKDMKNFAGFLASPIAYRIKTIKAHTETLKKNKPNQTNPSPSKPKNTSTNTTSNSTSRSSTTSYKSERPGLVGLHDVNAGLALATEMDFDMCVLV